MNLGDIKNIHTLHSLPEVDRFNSLDIPDSIQTTRNLVSGWLQLQKSQPRLSYIFCINLKISNEFIGLVAMNLREIKFRNAEIWIKIHPDYWNIGFGTEVINKIVHFGFNDLNLHRIEAGCATGNTASGRMLEKAGMLKEGTKRKILPVRGEWLDAYSYAILEEDFIKTEPG